MEKSNMKWVKANERQPENWNLKIIRNSETKAIIEPRMIYFALINNEERERENRPLIEIKWEGIEWLDETPEDPTKEKILCAALDYNGTIITGYRHSDCYKVLEMMRKTMHEVIDQSPVFVTLDLDDNMPDRDKQGFLTSQNRFVDRKEAWKIAVTNDQVVYGKESSDEFLISENLY